jgi:hypothetical protein
LAPSFLGDKSQRLISARVGIDAENGVEAGIGHPWSTIGSHDHAVRGRAVTEFDPVDVARLRVQSP